MFLVSVQNSRFLTLQMRFSGTCRLSKIFIWATPWQKFESCFTKMNLFQTNYFQMDRTTQTDATESRKNSPHRKTGKYETGAEFFFGGNESFCFGRDKRNFEERRKKKIAKVSGRSGSVQDEDAVAGQTHSLQDPDWLFCPIPGCGFWTKKPDRMSRHKICHVDEVKQSYRCPGNSSESND